MNEQKNLKSVKREFIFIEKLKQNPYYSYFTSLDGHQKSIELNAAFRHYISLPHAPFDSQNMHKESFYSLLFDELGYIGLFALSNVSVCSCMSGSKANLEQLINKTHKILNEEYGCKEHECKTSCINPEELEPLKRMRYGFGRKQFFRPDSYLDLT